MNGRRAGEERRGGVREVAGLRVVERVVDVVAEKGALPRSGVQRSEGGHEAMEGMIASRPEQSGEDAIGGEDTEYVQCATV